MLRAECPLITYVKVNIQPSTMKTRKLIKIKKPSHPFFFFFLPLSRLLFFYKPNINIAIGEHEKSKGSEGTVRVLILNCNFYFLHSTFHLMKYCWYLQNISLCSHFKVFIIQINRCTNYLNRVLSSCSLHLIGSVYWPRRPF